MGIHKGFTPSADEVPHLVAQLVKAVNRHGKEIESHRYTIESMAAEIADLKEKLAQRVGL
jgi:hypothetical protein